jgi:protein TonB
MSLFSNSERVYALIFAIAIHLGVAAFGINFQKSPAFVTAYTSNISIVGISYENSDNTFSSINEKGLGHNAKSKAISKKTSGIENENSENVLSSTSDALYNDEKLNNKPPFYPMSARKMSIEGKVLLEVEVNPEGFPNDIKIAKTSGYKILDSAALDAVSKWKFIPAKKGNINILTRIFIPIEFKLT